MTKGDVLSAWDNMLRWMSRSRGAFDETIDVGISNGGKALKMVAVFRADGTWLVYHTMRPPTDGALREVGLKEGEREEV